MGRLEQLSSYPQLCERIRTLVAAGHSAAAIAACLNAEGYRPVKQATHFSRKLTALHDRWVGLDHVADGSVALPPSVEQVDRDHVGGPKGEGVFGTA